ncbi:uncharacterized protein [Diadema antillarum]|uniref:uncharacterized protein n=1 Tax=Diadema antillarum TaxID=105358 RepID=UPI003A83566A
MTNNDGKRVFDKRYPCLYCQTMQSQIQRHLRDMHGQEHEVAAIQYEKDRKKRQKKMTLLRNKGTHRHNCTVLRNGKGTIHVVYRPAYATSAEDYGPCEHCLGYYVRRDLWKHNCPLKPSHQKKKHERPAKTCKLLLPPPRGVSPGLNKVLLTMKDDKISRIAKSDNLITEMAERQYRVHGHDKDKETDVRNNMRESGRLLSKLRKMTDNKNAHMSEFIHPRKFKTVVAAVKEVAGYDEETHQYKIPSLALKLGHTLQKMAKVQQGKGSGSGDDNMYHNAKKFSKRCTSDWSCFISSSALRTLHEQKRNRVELLPLTEDVVHLTNFLKERGRRSYQRLAADTSDSEAWNDLNEVTLAQITMFNRRRTGEMSKMKLSDYKKLDGLPDSTVIKSLSQLEKELCKKLSRVELVGRRGRLVPVLLTSEMGEWISALVDNRHQAGVNPENEYLFARSHSMSLGHIRASDCLRKFSSLCEVKHPDTITGTLLRKQLGTLCQLLSLKENEMEIVASFLGHDLHTVHRDFYRLPNEVLQVAKVSKILLSMEQGGEGLSQGETLDSVPVLNEELCDDYKADVLSDAEEAMSESHSPCLDAESLVAPVRELCDDYKADVLSDAEEAMSESHSPCLDAESLVAPVRGTKRKHPQRHFHQLILTNTLPELGDDYKADVLSDAEEAMSESHSPCLDAESLVAPVRGTKRKHPPMTRNRNIKKWKHWSPGEKAAVQRHFHQLILTNTLPRKSHIEQCLKEEPILHERTWRNIKDYVRNSFKQNKACR